MAASSTTRRASETAVTRWIQDRANGLLLSGFRGVARNAYNEARRAATIHAHDYVGKYVAELGSVVGMEVIRDGGSSSVRLAEQASRSGGRPPTGSVVYDK